MRRVGLRIALAWSENCEKELLAAGFEKREVYVKVAPPGPTEESNRAGDREFFAMKHPPFQFVTTSWWGMGAD